MSCTNSSIVLSQVPREKGHTQLRAQNLPQRHQGQVKMRQQEHLGLEVLTYFSAAEQGSQPMQTLHFLKSTFLILVNLLPLLHYYLPQVYLFTLILKVSYTRGCTFCSTRYSHCEFPKSPQHHLPHLKFRAVTSLNYSVIEILGTQGKRTLCHTYGSMATQR